MVSHYSIINVLINKWGEMCHSHLSDPLPRRVLGLADPPALLIPEVHARRQLGLPHEGDVDLKFACSVVYVYKVQHIACLYYKVVHLDWNRKKNYCVVARGSMCY